LHINSALEKIPRNAPRKSPKSRSDDFEVQSVNFPAWFGFENYHEAHYCGCDLLANSILQEKFEVFPLGSHQSRYTKSVLGFYPET